MSPWRSLAPDLYVFDHPLTVPGGLAIGTRSTLVALPGGLALHSPGPLPPAAIEAARALGEVRWILVANGQHHLSLPQAAAAFPDAEVLGVDSVRPKRPDVTFAGGFERLPDGLWGVHLGGMSAFVDEHLLVHPASGTLLCADLVFNIQRTDSWITRGVMYLNGGWQKFGPTRIFRSQVRDRAALRHSLDAVLEHRFSRVVLAHGDVLETEGDARTREAFAWV